MSTAVAVGTLSTGPLADPLTRHIGEDAQSVRRLEDISEQWGIIDQGLLVDVHIGHWRAETRMTLEDLGLDKLQNAKYVEALQSLTALGRKYLLPKRMILQMDRAEQRGRALVNRYSFNLRAGKFVPFTAYRSWKEANANAASLYFEVRDRICAQMPQLRREVLDGYVRIARQNFDLLRERDVSVGITRPAFVNRYVNRIAEQIPSADHVFESFRWETSLSFIPMPSALEEDLKRRENIRQQRQSQAEEAARLREMDADLAEHVRREKTEKIDGVLGHIQRQMLERMYEVTAELATRVRQKPTLSGAQVRSVRTMVQQLREMNFLGDESSEQRIARLEGLLETRRSAGAGDMAIEANLAPDAFLDGIDQLNDQIRQDASRLLSRRSVRAQMSIDATGSDMVFGRRVSRLRRDLSDPSVAVDLSAKTAPEAGAGRIAFH